MRASDERRRVLEPDHPTPRFPTFLNLLVREGDRTMEKVIMMIVAFFHFLVAELEKLRQASLREEESMYSVGPDIKKQEEVRIERTACSQPYPLGKP